MQKTNVTLNELANVDLSYMGHTWTTDFQLNPKPEGKSLPIYINRLVFNDTLNIQGRISLYTSVSSICVK